MDFWEHQEWWQQHQNILNAFDSLEKSNQYDSRKIQNELKDSNSKLGQVADGVSALSSQLEGFVSTYTQDRALAAQIEAERFEFNLYWQSLTIKERKDFLRARDEILANRAEAKRLAQEEWDAGAPERERNHQLIVEQNIKQSAIAKQMNKEYFERKNQQKQVDSQTYSDSLQHWQYPKRANITLWLAFIIVFSGWIGLANLWANSVQDGSVGASLALLFIPFVIALVISRWLVWMTFNMRFEKAATAHRNQFGFRPPELKLKFPYFGTK
jgi:hypothetical protein